MRKALFLEYGPLVGYRSLLFTDARTGPLFSVDHVVTPVLSMRLSRSSDRSGKTMAPDWRTRAVRKRTVLSGYKSDFSRCSPL